MIILEDVDFCWNREEIKTVKKAWVEGLSLVDISKVVDRDTFETMLLLMHLGRREEILVREGYVWGKKHRM